MRFSKADPVHDLEVMIYPGRGEVLLNGARAVLLGIEAMGRLRKDLLTGIGADLAKGVLGRLGYRAGRLDALRLRDLLAGKDERERLRTVLALQSVLGHADGRLESLEHDPRTGRLAARGSWRSSFEAQEHVKALGHSEHPVCWVLAGYASGAASEVLSREVVCWETACAGTGAETCSFEILDLERAGPAAREFHSRIVSPDLKQDMEMECARCEKIHDLEESGRRERELLRRIVEDSLNGIIAIDRDEVIQSWNRGAEAIYGFTAAEMIGKPVTVLIPPELQAAGEVRYIQEAMDREGTLRNFVTERIRKDGRRITIQFTRTKICDSSGTPIGSTAVITDITEMLQIRERLERERALSAIGQTVASIAHDLRSPIQTVRSAADLLRANSGDPPAVEKIAQELEGSMGSIERLVDDLLAFSRDQRPVRIPTPVAMILEAIAEEMRGQLAEAVSCIFQVPPEGALLPCDAFKIKQALSNLIRNAAEAMPGGGTVTVSARVDQERWVIEVADNGPGIPGEFQQKIFEPFYTTKQKGTGLGLAIVRKIIDAHQGTLEVESAPGQGSRFRILLPIHRPSGS